MRKNKHVQNDPVLFLALIDVLLLSSFGMLFPIFPLFLMDTIVGVTIQNVAVAYALYLTSSAIFSWIYMTFLHHGDAVFRAKNGLVIGSFVVMITPLLYLYATEMTQILLIQIMLGFGFALVKTSWSRLTHAKLDFLHIEPLLQTRSFLTTFVLAIAAVLGGYVTYQHSYQALFGLMFSIAFSGFAMSFLVAITKHHKTKKWKVQWF